MAITRAENQVTWSAANSLSVSAASTGTSDAMSLDATCFAAMAHCYADNASTPAAGDTVDFYILMSGGDPIGTGGDVFDNSAVAHATFLCTIDTNSADPAQRSVPLPLPHKTFKIFARNNDAGAAATVGVTITELRG